MTVTIDPNIVKERARIDINGVEIDPRTKKPLKQPEPSYVPPPEWLVKAKQEEKDKKNEMGDKIQQMIEEKVSKIIEEKINKALEKLL